MSRPTVTILEQEPRSFWGGSQILEVLPQRARLESERSTPVRCRTDAGGGFGYGEGVYRVPAKRDTEAVLEVRLADGARSRRASMIGMQLFAVPPVVAAVLAGAASPTAGLVGLVASGLGCYALGRHLARDDVRWLHVRGGDVLVGDREGSLRHVAALSDLLDVGLETKTVTHMLEGASAIPAVRFEQATAGPEIDTARIGFVTERGTSHPLGETYISHLYAAEALSQVRVFLRKNGWVPADERDASP